MKEKIFVLGGSPLQRDLIEKAKVNYHTVLIDGNDNCALRDEADEFHQLDFSDIEKLHDLAISVRPKLILTMANEQGNLSAAVVSKRLGLKYNDPEVVFSTVNKKAMKLVMNKNNIPTSDYIAIDSTETHFSLEKLQSFPLVVKPSHSSGGRGVKLVSNESELNEAVENAKLLSRDGCALIEDFIKGRQYSVETITCNYKHSIIGITNEYFGKPPNFAETQQLFPSDIDEPTKLKVHKFIINILDCFKIQYGACHIEFRINPNGEFYLIEIASRIGGWRSELINNALGLEYADLLLKSYEKEQLNIQPKFNNYSIVKMIFNKDDYSFYKKLSNDQKFTLTEISWLKEEFAPTQSSLMDSSGFYFITTRNLKDALNVI